MTAWTKLASGPDWRVSDIVCTAGPHDRPFEERHEALCIAVVTDGTFQYRSSQGATLLAPGAVLLGNDGYAYECSHAHGAGDRCLAFHYAPARWEAIVAALPGARRTAFAVPRIPPLTALLPLFAAAAAARDLRDGAELEELALRIGGAVSAALLGGERAAGWPSPRDERRITDALRRIESQASEPIALDELAREAAMSPYHFLRTFRRLVGMTPYQFVLHTRLERAAVRLRLSKDSVSAIAFEAGFGDLSTFNRRFRRIMGVSPSTYRASRGAMGAEH